MGTLRDYWAEIGPRAFKASTKVAGITREKLVRDIIKYGIVVGALVGFGYWAFALERGGIALLLIVATVSVALVVFGVQFLAIQPAALWKEQSDALALFKKAAGQRDERMQQLRELEALYKKSQELDSASTVGDDWCSEVESWDREVQEALVRGFPHEAFAYDTVSERPPPPGATVRLGATMKFLKGRANKLRLIIMRAHAKLDQANERGEAK